MNEQEIINKLNNLKTSLADATWRKSNRSILVSQIYGSSINEAELEFNWPLAFFKGLSLSLAGKVSRSIAATILVLFFVASTGAASIIAARETKPGDSLYMAKIVGEKAQLVFTFDESAKAKLGLRFASNRAEELSQVLAEEGQDAAKARTAESLVSDFKKEISEVKSRIEKISPRTMAVAPKTTANEGSRNDQTKTATSEISQADNHFFQADLGKDKNGIDLAEPETGSKNTNAAATSPATTSKNLENEAASSTPSQLPDPKALVEQAQELLNQKDYEGIISKLDEADKAISQVKIDDKQGIPSENATTSISDLDADKSSTSTIK